MINQVLSKEQMEELEMLGIDISKASMFWFIDGRFVQLIPCANQNNIQDWTDQYGEQCVIPAFTLQDILTLLPYRISTTYPSYLSIHPLHDGGWYIRYSRMECDEKSIGGKTLLEAAFNMLKWCKENQYI